MAFACYLYQHVVDGYKFLMQNYKDGDRVCFFGAFLSPSEKKKFIRGAIGRFLSWRLYCKSSRGDVA